MEGNVGTAFELSFLSLLIFSDPTEIRLGSVAVFNIKTFKTGFGVAIRQVLTNTTHSSLLLLGVSCVFPSLNALGVK